MKSLISLHSAWQHTVYQVVDRLHDLFNGQAGEKAHQILVALLQMSVNRSIA